MTEGQRCSALSLGRGEPIAGTAPTDPVWLFVEEPGPWGRQALAESRMAEPVRERLRGLDGVRVQLIRRPGARTGSGARVYAATAGGGAFLVEGTRLDRAEDLLDLPLDRLAAGRGLGLPSYDADLWLVCTNGRRDLCCAELGRPVAAALAASDPESVWETTHLGGHRFAGTLLHLPSGWVLGRVDSGSAARASADLLAGRVPLAQARGRAGDPPAAQVAELHLRTLLDLPGLDQVRCREAGPNDVTLEAAGVGYRVGVESTPGPPVRQSCADQSAKPVTRLAVVGVARLSPPDRPDSAAG